MLQKQVVLCYIGIGSNLGDRQKNIEDAHHIGTELRCCGNERRKILDNENDIARPDGFIEGIGQFNIESSLIFGR